MKHSIVTYEKRYFKGIKVEGGISVNSIDPYLIPNTWNLFFSQYLNKIQNQTTQPHFIGLEYYEEGFQETGNFDYYCMAEITEKQECKDDLFVVELPEGRYIEFPIEFSNIKNEIQNVYEYIRSNKIKVEMMFDYEDYLPEYNYSQKGAILNFCLKLRD
jgi:predicted transcriptional regulator YdeE